MQERPAAIELDQLGVLRIRGADALRFLQGQLSNDLERLASEGSLLAGYHNPQGRAIAVLRLVPAEGDILAILPRELIATVTARLARYVLRAKVQLLDDSAHWRVRGVLADEAPQAPSMKVSDAPARWIALAPASSPAMHAAAREEWTRLDIAAGLPQVYSATSELYVAQMLNLDLLDGVAFSKGCYTGQEVIARTHYRGRMKRRMQRWRTLERCTLVPGDSGHFEDGRAFRVVEAAPLPGGRSEFLAVAPLDAHSSAQGEEAPPAADGASRTLAVEPLALPYPLPG